MLALRYTIFKYTAPWCGGIEKISMIEINPYDTEVKVTH